jgi:Bacteriophage head-tail adaptor
MINSPGEMIAQIRIQKEVSSGTGSFVTKSWVDIGSPSDTGYPWIYAKWENVHGTEAWAANSVQASAAATVTVWYNPSINHACRVVDDAGIVYDIVSLDDVRKRHEQIEMKLKASVMG